MTGRRLAGASERSLLVAVVAVALLALGAGALLVASASGESGHVVGGNVAVSPGADEPRDITAHNSPALARNPADPDHLAAVNRVDTPTFSCALHVSRNAGGDWEPVDIPFPDGEEQPERCYAPDVAFDADGRLHVSFVTLKGVGNVPNALWTASSDNGGNSLDEPVRVAGAHPFQARLVADPTEPGRLHLTWLHASGVNRVGFAEAGNPIVAARSDDAGATWTEPVTVSDAARERVLAPAPAVGPDGELVVAYLDLRDDRLDYHGGHEGRGGPAYPGPWSLVLARSDDGGSRWTGTVVDDAVVPIDRVVAFLPAFPSVAVDSGSGRVHVAFHDARRGDADVLVWTSHDAGAGFAGPVRVNDTPEGDGTTQSLPALSVAGDGRLDVVYYDRRGDPDDVMTEVSLQSSTDGAAGFTPRMALSDRAFDSRIGFGGERGLPDLGSRLAVVSTERAALAMWADTRAGTQASNKQVLAQAVAVVSPPSALAQTLRVAGVTAAAAGVALLAWWLVAPLRAGRGRGRQRSPAAPPAGPRRPGELETESGVEGRPAVERPSRTASGSGAETEAPDQDPVRSSETAAAAERGDGWAETP